MLYVKRGNENAANECKDFVKTLDPDGADLASMEALEALALALALALTLIFTLTLSAWDSGSSRSGDGGTTEAGLAAKAAESTTGDGGGEPRGRTSRSRGIFALALTFLVTAKAADTTRRAVETTARLSTAGGEARGDTGWDGARRTLATLDTTRGLSTRRSATGSASRSSTTTKATAGGSITTKATARRSTTAEATAEATARGSTAGESAGGLNTTRGLGGRSSLQLVVATELEGRSEIKFGRRYSSRYIPRGADSRPRRWEPGRGQW